MIVRAAEFGVVKKKQTIAFVGLEYICVVVIRAFRIQQSTIGW